MMSRSGVFYAVKAMERVAAGSAADDMPAGREAARRAPAVARSAGRIVSLVRRALAAMPLGMGGARAGAGQGNRRLDGAARAD
jgi:hypothetical protein